MISIRARFDGQVIVPDEPLDLPPQQRLIARIEPIDSDESALDWLVQHAVVSDELPSDLAEQHDHYLYGTPKRDESAS